MCPPLFYFSNPSTASTDDWSLRMWCDDVYFGKWIFMCSCIRSVLHMSLSGRCSLVIIYKWVKCLYRVIELFVPSKFFFFGGGGYKHSTKVKVKLNFWSLKFWVAIMFSHLCKYFLFDRLLRLKLEFYVWWM